MNFNLPIYKLITNLSFWSENEYLYRDQGDYAYIQYLDKDGSWKTCFDLLDDDTNLPTDRTNQMRFDYDFIEGTTSIKFVAHKGKPNTNRNKGRISIGETSFVTYSLI